MLRRAIVILSVVALGCDLYGPQEPFHLSLHVVVVKTDSGGPSLRGTYVEAYADSSMEVLVRRSRVELVDDGTAHIGNFWLPEGTYYLRAWKDVDGNGRVSPGDIYGTYCVMDTVCTGPYPKNINTRTENLVIRVKTI